MKRFSEFIKQLSLSQQLAAIIFFLISFFTAFFFIYLTGSVENVIREQMYTTLDTSQDMIVGLYSLVSSRSVSVFLNKLKGSLSEMIRS